jgi:hypothetical protein
VALLRARINQDESSVDYLTQDLRNVYTDTDPRTYPLSSYSYIILPTALQLGFTEDKGLTLADFGAYFLCEGQQQAETLGYSPLPVNLVLAGQAQIEKIPGGNPIIKGIAQCRNPTLDPSDPNGNALAKNAPFPSACDKKGQEQCSEGTGGAPEETEDTRDPGSGGPNGGTSPEAGAGNTGTGGPNGNGEIGSDGAGVEGSLLSGDAEVVALGEDPALAIAAARPQSIPPPPARATTRLAMLGVGGGLLAAAILPPVLAGHGGHRPKSRLGVLR